jgi:hypothetical protein
MNNPQEDKQVTAYERMLERTKHFLADMGEGLAPKFEQGLSAAKEKATELGELSLEEAEKIGNYLRRDLYDAAKFLAEDRGELKDWLRLDVELVEERILEQLSHLVDETKVDLAALAEQAQREGEWHTGEVTGPGTLVCDSCGEILHFHKTGHIPPCPKCKATVYHRGATQ